MLVALLAATAVSAVPKVSAGPDLADRATAIDAPIDKVEVFSDRARATRVGSFSGPAGVLALRLPDLPGATWLDTVRASARGATVLRVEAIPVQRERISIDQVDDLLVKLEAETDALARLDAKIAARRQQLAATDNLRPANPVPEKDRRGPVQWAERTWAKVLDFFSGERAEVRAKLRALEIERRAKRRALERTQREVQGMNLGAFSDQKVQVLVLLELTQASKGRVELSYDVPGAFWKPAYDLHYDAKAGRVELATYGVVQQATGEGWDDVQLLLSTAIPGRDIALPELLTWTLGEAKEFIPRPRARTSPRQPPRYPAPQASQDEQEIERQARQALLQRRINQLMQLARVDVKRDNWFQPNQGSSGASIGDLAVKRPAPRRRAESARRSRKRQAAPKMAFEEALLSAPAAPPSMPMADEADSELSIASTAGRSSSASSTRVRRTALDLFEARPRRRGPSFSDGDLPAVSAAGFEYVFSARTRMSVPSTNQPLRAPLGRSNYPVTAFYEASPALAKNAYLKAEVRNPGPQPILRGPVTIFVNGGFAGDGRLGTTPAGGTLELPFGADEDIELVYQVVPNTVTTGVFGKDEVTTYKVMMEIVNHKRRKVQVVLREPLPRSRHEDIDVELVKTSVKPDEKDDRSILKWTVDIAPGRKQSVELVYKIRRPEGWQLQQQ